MSPPSKQIEKKCVCVGWGWGVGGESPRRRDDAVIKLGNAHFKKYTSRVIKFWKKSVCTTSTTTPMHTTAHPVDGVTYTVGPTPLPPHHSSPPPPSPPSPIPSASHSSYLIIMKHSQPPARSTHPLEPPALSQVRVAAANQRPCFDVSLSHLSATCSRCHCRLVTWTGRVLAGGGWGCMGSVGRIWHLAVSLERGSLSWDGGRVLLLLLLLLLLLCVPLHYYMYYYYYC